MMSPHALDELILHRQQRLIAEAEHERLVALLPAPERPGPRVRLRLRLAAALYALADRLSAETASLECATPTLSGPAG